MVAAVLVELERHDRHPGGRKGGALLRHSAPQHQPTDPCTTLQAPLSHFGLNVGQLAPHGFQHAVDRSPVRLIRLITIVFEAVEDREGPFDTQNIDRLGPSHSLDAKYGLTAYKL